MKTILLHSAAVDNLDNYCDAGRELTISDSAESGHISAERASELIDVRRAIDAAKAGEAGDGLDGSTIAKLRELAEEEKVDLGELTLKAEIVAAIRQHRLNPPSELASSINSPQLDPPASDA